MTTDMPVAEKFYRDAFGWGLQGLISPAMPYTIAKKDDREAAGITGIPNAARDMSPSWGPYFTVNDVNARVARAEPLGGKLCLAPQDIPNIGRFAVIADPQGALLAMIAYSARSSCHGKRILYPNQFRFPHQAEREQQPRLV